MHASLVREIEYASVVSRGGTVDGAITANGFEVHLEGRFFEARMAVAGQGCDQSVTVLPQKSDMFRELAATLKKC